MGRTTTVIGFGAALACVAGWGAGLGCGGKVSAANGGGASGGGSGSSSGGSAGGSSGGSSGSSSGGSSGGSSGSSADDEGIVGDDAGNPLSGTYKGYFQSFTFPDGTNTVVMTLTFAGDKITGTVFFGNGPPLAPPTNPDVGYPPGYTGSVTPYIGGIESTSLFEGFDFTVLSGTYAAPRVQLQIQSAQMWSEWCALQTSYPWNDSDEQPDGGYCSRVAGSYGCVPPGLTMCDGHVGSQGCYLLGPTPVSFSACEINPVCQPGWTPGWTPIDCGKLDLCRGGLQTQVCNCTATGCSAWGQSGDILFDMQLASGTLNGGETGMGSNGVDSLDELNVILTRQ